MISPHPKTEVKWVRSLLNSIPRKVRSGHIPSNKTKQINYENKLKNITRSVRRVEGRRVLVNPFSLNYADSNNVDKMDKLPEMRLHLSNDLYSDVSLAGCFLSPHQWSHSSWVHNTSWWKSFTLIIHSLGTTWRKETMKVDSKRRRIQKEWRKKDGSKREKKEASKDDEQK